jgi:DNA-binding Lrp family transcriptional regulator
MRPIFVQIKCEMGQAYRVAREAADTIGEMSELFSTSGQYDLLGKFYLDADQDIGLFVTEKIQTLKGVKDTYTLITFNAFSAGMISATSPTRMFSTASASSAPQCR